MIYRPVLRGQLCLNSNSRKFRAFFTNPIVL